MLVMIEVQDQFLPEKLIRGHAINLLFGVTNAKGRATLLQCIGGSRGVEDVGGAPVWKMWE